MRMTRKLTKFTKLPEVINCRHAVRTEASQLSLRRFFSISSKLAHDSVKSKREIIKNGPCLSHFFNDPASPREYNVDLTTEDDYLGAHLFQGNNKRGTKPVAGLSFEFLFIYF